MVIHHLFQIRSPLRSPLHWQESGYESLSQALLPAQSAQIHSANQIVWLLCELATPITHMCFKHVLPALLSCILKFSSVGNFDGGMTPQTLKA